MLALVGQYVRWYLCMFEFECVIFWYTMHYRNSILACYSTTMAMVYDMALRSCWCWSWLNIWNGTVLDLDGQKVRWYWCMLNLNMSLLGIRYLVKPSQLYTCLPSTQIHYNDIHLWPRAHVDWTYETVYRVGFGRTESTLVFGHVWIGMWHCLVHAAPWHDHNWTLTWYSTTMAIAHGSALVLMLLECMEHNGKWLRAVVDWMYGTVYRVAFGRVVGTMVNIGACLNWKMCHYLVYAASWHHRDCTHACYSTAMAITHVSALMLIEYMERYCIDFRRTESTLVLVHVWIWICHTLLGIRCNIHAYHHRNYTLACYSTTMAMPYVSIWADVNRIYGTVSYWLWMNREYVGSYWCMFEFERVIILCMMQHDTITIAHSPAIQIHYNGNDNDTRFCADVDVDWIYGTVLC